MLLELVDFFTGVVVTDLRVVLVLRVVADRFSLRVAGRVTALFSERVVVALRETSVFCLVVVLVLFLCASTWLGCLDALELVYSASPALLCSGRE